MADDEFDAYLHYLAEEYVEPRLKLVRARCQMEHDRARVISTLEGLRKSYEAVNYIYTVDDIDGRFKRSALEEIIKQASAGVAVQDDLLDASGVMDVMDEHFTDVASELRADHLPTSETKMLETLGFARIAAHLPGLVYEVKNSARLRRQKEQFRGRRFGVRHEVSDLKNVLEQGMRERAPAEPSPRKRKWWTGLSKVITGSVITIADISLAIGLLPFEVALETRSYGAFTSSTLGIGQLLEGVGALKGE